MNKNDKKSLKSLLDSRGIYKLFCGMYKEYGYADNPNLIENYFDTVPRDLAIRYAFDVTKITSPIYNAKYWDELNKIWLERNSESKPVDIKAEKSEILVESNWAGLDLIGVQVTSKKKIPMPTDAEIRVNAKGGKQYTIVINSMIVKNISEKGFNTMSVQVDRRTNRMVWVFGYGLTYYVSSYSKDTKCINSKAIYELLEKYLDIKFDPKKIYYIKLAEKIWSLDKSAYAIVISQKYDEKER